jgi:hypothetical protein
MLYCPGDLGSLKRINKSMLLFGPSGSGKTMLLGHAANDPRTSPLLVLNFEGGCSSIEGSGATIIQVNNLEDLNIQYDRLEASLKNEFDVEYEIFNLDTGSTEIVKYSKFRSVAIDSISEFYTKLLLERGEQRVEELKDKEKNSSQTVDKRRLNPNALEQSDYGLSLSQLRVVIRAFRDTLNRHFFMTALPKTDIIPGEGAVRLPKLDGQAAEEVAGAVDSCIYISTKKSDKKGEENNNRILALNNFPGVRAKTRTKWKQKIRDFIPYSDDDNPITMLFDELKIEKEN